jgi:hypothetical protein
MHAHCKYTLHWSVQPLALLSFNPLPPTPHLSTAFNTHPPLLSHFMFYMTDALSFSFPFPEFHRVVPLLQTCST